MRIFSRVFLLILAALGLILAVVLYYIVNPKLPDYVAVQQVHYGEQWSAADRDVPPPIDKRAVRLALQEDRLRYREAGLHAGRSTFG